jgi:hypothetical protein
LRPPSAQSGCRPDPPLPNGVKVGSPLNCAARNAKNQLVIKTLLDFGADTESYGVDGKTPLIHVSRTDNIEFALLLLEYGADINATSKAGHTPLTTAITHNSCRVLQLLLDHWAEYSVFSRLNGPNLVATAARFADLQILHILAKTNHFKLQFDKNYSVTGCLEEIQRRFDSSNDLIETLRDFIGLIITEHAGLNRNDDEALLESGLLHRDVEYEKSDDESSEVFADAVEEQVAENVKALVVYITTV